MLSFSLRQVCGVHWGCASEQQLLPCAGVRWLRGSLALFAREEAEAGEEALLQPLEHLEMHGDRVSDQNTLEYSDKYLKHDVLNTTLSKLK